VLGCNRHDYSGYGKDKSFEYGLGIEKKYGPGAALFLYKLSKQYNQWTTNELSQLRSAARIGFRAYEQLYYELRPEHRFTVSES
jgi:predicted metal-dependent HD superfamily phosphohydrolase